MSSLYPQYIDVFTTKRNETGSNDGDYVYAEHVNDLQDSIIAIESTLGLNPQGSYSNIAQRLVNSQKTQQLGLPRAGIYKGDLVLVNGAGSIEKAARYYAYLDHVIMSGVDIYSANAADIRNVVESTKAISAGTLFYGEVDSGLFTLGYSVPQIGILVEKWAEAGVDGIYFSNFGYDKGNSRARQNELIELVHNSNLATVVNTTSTLDILENTISELNPSGDPIILDERDAYLRFGFGLDTGGYVSQSNITLAGQRLLDIRSTFGTKIFVLDYINDADKAAANKKYYYGQALSMLYSFDAYYARKTVLQNNSLDVYISMPIVGNVYDQSPKITVSGNFLKRQSPVGEISVDTSTQSYSLKDIKIPLGYIDFTADNATVPASKISGGISGDQLDIDIVAEINGSTETVKISPTKIDFLQASSQIVESLNLIANNESPKINSSILSDLSVFHIEGILLQAISDVLNEELLSGTYSANFIAATAAQISAINAYIENMRAENIQAEYIDGMAIKAGSITGDILSTNTVTSDKLSIHANSGTNKWNGTIVSKTVPGPIYTPTLDMVIGKDPIKRIEYSEVEGVNNLSTNAYMSSLTQYMVLWDTNVFCTDAYQKPLTLTTSTRASLYVNGTKVVTSDADGIISYTMTLNSGWNKIQIVQDHVDEVNTYVSIGMSFMSEALRTEKGDLSGIARIDAYADKVTQITGDFIKTGTIELEHLQAGTLSASNITTGSLDAEEYIMIGNNVRLDGAEGILLQNGTGVKVSGPKSIDISEGSLVVTENTSDRVILGKYDIAKYGLKIITELEGGELGTAIELNKDGLIAGSNLQVLSDGSVFLAGSLMATEGRFAGKIGVGTSRFSSVDDAVIIIDGSNEANPYILIKVEPTTTSYDAFDEAGNPVIKTETTPGGYLRINKEGMQTSEDGLTWITKFHAGGFTIGNTDIGDGVITTDKINVKEVNAGLVSAGMIQAIDAYIQNIAAGNGDFETLLVDFLKANQIDATKLSFISEASNDPLNKGFLEITNGGMLVSSLPRVGGVIPTGPSGAHLVKIDKSGIFVSPDGGLSWNEKLTGSGLNVTSGEIINLAADKIASGSINVNTSINIANKVAIDGASGILVDGGTGAGITVVNGQILVKESLSDRIIIGYDGSDYGFKLITTDSTITLDKRGLTSTNFSIGTTGKIVAIDGQFQGKVESKEGAFGDALNKIEIDSQGLVLGTGSIVDTRDVLNQALNISKDGIVASKGVIGGIDIVPVFEMIGEELTLIDSKLSADGRFSLDSNSITVSGPEAVVIEDGTLVVKKNDVPYVFLGSLGGSPVSYGMKVDLYTEMGAPTDAYIQLDQFGLKAFNGTTNTLSITNTGNITIAGEVIATSGTLSGLTVNGNIAVTGSGNITAGNVTINESGLSGTGYSLTNLGLTATGGKIANWIIGANSLSSGDISIDSLGKKITVPGATLGQYSAGVYGIQATQGQIGGWSISGTSLAAAGITLDAANKRISTNGVMIGEYDTGLYGISAYNGRIGGWTLSADGLNSASIRLDSSLETIEVSDQLILGQYEEDAYGLKAGSVILNATGLLAPDFSIGSEGVTATGGKIGGWTVENNQIYSSTIHLDADTNGPSIWLGSQKGTAKVIFNASGESRIGVIDFNKTVDLVDYSMYTPKFSIDSSGNVKIEGQVTATSGTFSGTIQATGGYFGGSDKVTIDGNGLTAGGVKISGTGITVGEDALRINASGIYVNSNTSSITLGSYFSASNAGIVSTAGTIGGWVIDSTRIYSKELEIPRIQLDAANNVIAISDSLTIGKLTAGGYGLQAGSTILNGTGIHANQGDIAGWNISETEISKTSGNIKTSLSDGSISLVNLVDPENPVKVVSLNKDGTANIGSLLIDAAGNITSTYFNIIDGDAVFSGELNAASGTFNGNIAAAGGTIGGWDISSNAISKNNVIMNSSTGISLGGTITLDGSNGIKVTSGGNVNFSLDLMGNLKATSADIEGKITATSGSLGGWTINGNSITDSATEPRFSITSEVIGNEKASRIEIRSGDSSRGEELIVGQYGVSATNIPLYGIKAGNTILDNRGITAKSGTIGGIHIGESYIQSDGYQDGVSGFKLYTEGGAGKLEANDVKIRGVVKALSGQFGGDNDNYRITINSSGIYHGSAPVAGSSNFFISSDGNAYFRGSLQVSQESLVDGGNIRIASGNIMAGDPVGAHVKMAFVDEAHGGEISAVDKDGITTFKVNNTDAEFRGKITATTGAILGDLSVGSDLNILITGNSNQTSLPGIYLYDFINDVERIVRLSNNGLYVSIDGGGSWEPALTGGGINANVINDGILKITDTGQGASGISIQQYNYLTDTFVENVSITPAGINVLNGAITVYSETNGEVLIGGGYLRVKGLDMGVVTSNNFIGNGNFAMVSEGYGVKQNNNGEVFLGRAQSSGGAISNPTYHYVGWPDYGDRDPHTVYTYNIGANGMLNNYTPGQFSDPNHPVVSRVSFNPQWVAVHPITGHGIVPADADNFISIVDPDTGLIVRHMKSWKGGLFGADFSADGTTMIACGDDIDRKRAPWDMVVFDTSSADPNDWFLKGVIEVGEFPSKVVCDTSGHYAYVTISLDNTIYKLDLQKMRVDKILNMTDPRGMAVTPMAIGISNDEQFIYVGGVVTDAVYEVPVDFNTKIEDCRMFSVAPYAGNRGIPHDVHVVPTADGKNGYIVVSSASTTDGYVLLVDPTRSDETYTSVTIGMKSDGLTPRKMINNAVVTWIDGTMDGINNSDGTTVNKLSYPPEVTEKEKAAWNFLSTTTITPHPDPAYKLIYATVTNRCMISVLDYTSGELIELQRIPAGSNASGIRVSMAKDELGNITRHKLFVSNHHFHTYPLGANKVWGYRSSDNYYYTADVFDTGQTYYHFNPSGLLVTDEDFDNNNNHKLWIANRATNEVTIVSTDAWANRNSWIRIKDVGNKPYEIKALSDHSKIYVSNDDSDNKFEPDFVTVIDKATKTIEGRIYVGDNPMGIEIKDDTWLYVACNGMNSVQKVSIATKKVVDTQEVLGSPRHLKLVGDKLYVTCSDSNLVYCLSSDSLDIVKVFNEPDAYGVQPIAELRYPSQMEHVSGKLYITNKSSDHIVIIDTATNTVSGNTIRTGSSPNPIHYNQETGHLYVGNSGEGSVCIIDPTIDQVVEWSMTGDNPEYITSTSSGDRWYVSAHGPEDIVVYPEGSFTGDAYLDNNGNTHKYGAAYWVPSRSQWVRGADRTLTSFSSVEFWPESELQGKKGHAFMTVMGMFDAFAMIEQDVYPLINASDGSSDVLTELMELGDGEAVGFSEQIANFDGITGREYSKIVVSERDNPDIIYEENIDYRVDYVNNSIIRIGSRMPVSGVIQTLTIEEIAPMIDGGYKYNLIDVFPATQTIKYKEGQDYTIDRLNNTIVRAPDGDIPSGKSLMIIYRYQVNARYYYHPNKRNYEDVVMSADLFWKWPRPENQTVKMQIDELVPKFIMLDNDNTETFIPVHDFGRGDKDGKYYEASLPVFNDNIMAERLTIPEYKGLTYSSLSNRALSSSAHSSAIPVSGNKEEIDIIKTGAGLVTLPSGVQYIELDMGVNYYINKIFVDYGAGSGLINNALVEISMDGINWTEVYSNPTSPRSFEVTFDDTFKGDTYKIAKKLRYVRVYSEGTSSDPLALNQYKQIKIMGDWKSSKAYLFSSGTIWDSEGKREVYLSFNGNDPVRFDDPTLTTDPFAPNTRPNQRVRYRVYYTNPEDEHTTLGEVHVYNLVTGAEYKGVMARDKVTQKTYEELGMPLPTNGEQYDYAFDYMKNTMWRLDGSSIADGEDVRVIFRFRQEDLSNLPLAISYKDPTTGKEVPEHPASVAETDVTSAWVEWSFSNEYRCDWYIGWIADIGLGDIDIYLDDKLIHSISQMSTKVERFSQLTTDLLPGEHKIRLVQRQGRVNFDIIKLEDYQLLFRKSETVASPTTNPVELFTWFPVKLRPEVARTYLGRGTQILSGAYDNPRVDKDTRLPNNQVPIKYRVRFVSTLEDRGDPIPDYGGTGGEAVGNEFTFERGSVMITGVTMEHGVNPTYWRMAPAADKYTGFMIQKWDESDPSHTGIQNAHIANGAVTGEKIKPYSISDSHINSNANIQESKLLLNYATHPHNNKSLIDSITGWGTSGTSTLMSRDDHVHEELSTGTFTGSVSIAEDLTVEGRIVEKGKYEIVHRRPLYGLAGDLQFQTNSSVWEDIVLHMDLFGYGVPAAKEGSTRYYRLYAVYGDNITSSDDMRARIKIKKSSDSSLIHEWKLPNTWGAANGRRDAYSNYFQAVSGESSHAVCAIIQNDSGSYAGTDKEVGIEWIELIAYDVYE